MTATVTRQAESTEQRVSWTQNNSSASLNSPTHSFNGAELPAKPLLFASRQNTLILHLWLFIPVLNVPFRALTLKDPSLHAATDPAVWLRLSPPLYPWTRPQLGQKARVKQRDYQCHSHRGSQTVTQIKAAPSWPSVISDRCTLIFKCQDKCMNSALSLTACHREMCLVCSAKSSEHNLTSQLLSTGKITTVNVWNVNESYSSS